jgi:hypothetical protein
MFAVLSLVACLAAQPWVCETVLPDMTRVDGARITWHECLGIAGQDIARVWIAEHPGYVLRKIQCSVSSDERQLREQLASPEA